MKKKTAGEIFLRPLIPAAAVFYSIAAITGFISLVFLVDPAYRRLLLEDMILAGFTDLSAQITYTVINTSITLICFLCPCIYAVCLWICVSGRRIRGTLLLSTATELLLKIWKITGMIVLAIFVIRVLIYIPGTFRSDLAVYLLFALFLFESFMLVVAVAVFRLIQKFLNNVLDTSAAIGYALASDLPEKCFIPGFTATGFLLLAVTCLALTADRLFTLTIKPHPVRDYYALLVAEHPVVWITGSNMISIAAANVLMFVYLRICKRDTERCSFFLARMEE